MPEQSRSLTISDPGADLSVFIGRDVGYDLIELDAATEAISATDLRKNSTAQHKNLQSCNSPQRSLMSAVFPILWLTGNSGAGKTTLAYGGSDISTKRNPRNYSIGK